MAEKWTTFDPAEGLTSDKILDQVLVRTPVPPAA